MYGSDMIPTKESTYSVLYLLFILMVLSQMYYLLPLHILVGCLALNQNEM